MKIKIPLFLLLSSLGFTHNSSAQCSTGNAICVGSDCSTSIYANGAVEHADGASSDNVNFNSFKVNSLTNGKVETRTDFTRVGGAAIKHSVWTDTHRAEVSDNSFSHPRKTSSGSLYNFWYGWSIYIPNTTNWSSSTLIQYLGQWRWSNLDGCVTQKECDSTTVGGSGNYLILDGGRLIYTVNAADSSCATSGRLKKTRYDLGAPAKGVWMDFIMQARWTSGDTGYITISRQDGAGKGYKQVMSHTGPTWLGVYNNVSGCNYQGQETSAPNWTVGLYYSNDAPSSSDPRVMNSDEMKCYRTLCTSGVNSEGWNYVKR
jgi:hypothetical protein